MCGICTLRAPGRFSVDQVLMQTATTGTAVFNIQDAGGGSFQQPIGRLCRATGRSVNAEGYN